MSVIASYYYNEGKRVREVAGQEPFGLLLDRIE
jgi:hypothetical protein